MTANTPRWLLCFFSPSLTMPHAPQTSQRYLLMQLDSVVLTMFSSFFF